MTEKTEALRLAEQLEAIGLRGPVAAELRRLHAEVERLSLDGIHSCHAECQRPLCKLTRERDALLEACRFYASMMGRRKSDGEPFYMTALDFDCGDRARAAIKAVEEQK